MDNKTSTQNGVISSSLLKDARDIRVLKSRTIEGTTLDIPASGIEQSVINEMPANQPFYGREPDGTMNQYVIINNELFKTPANLTKL